MRASSPHARFSLDKTAPAMGQIRQKRCAIGEVPGALCAAKTVGQFRFGNLEGPVRVDCYQVTVHQELPLCQINAQIQPITENLRATATCYSSLAPLSWPLASCFGTCLAASPTARPGRLIPTTTSPSRRLPHLRQSNPQRRPLPIPRPLRPHPPHPPRLPPQPLLMQLPLHRQLRSSLRPQPLRHLQTRNTTVTVTLPSGGCFAAPAFCT